MSLILVVDDVPAMCEQYAYDLNRLGGFDTVIATNGREALKALDREPVDCMLLDLEMPVMDGFEVLRALEDRKERVPVIVYTNTGNFDRCVRAVKLGAYSFIDKGEPMERVVREIENALERGRLASEVHSLRGRLEGETRIVGDSPAMKAMRDAIARVAPIPSPVLIVGESGTGKELVARELHRLSGRPDPFLPINCAALPESLVESELFGHERGAFTGAERLRKGAFEYTGGGTLFLDEIGELPLTIQAKLLRVLEENEIVRVGGNRPVPVTCRVLTATNRSLETEVREGRFREDLFYRLNVHLIRVPPLRERLSDIPGLITHFVTDTCRRFGIRPKRVHPDVLEELRTIPWVRNNVRELRNIVERMIIAGEGDVIDTDAIPPEVAEIPTTVAAAGERSLKALRHRAERQILLEALERNDWHITRTADELGLADHSSLLRIMRRHDLRRP